ncbi:SAM-dependent methyltransferase, partial [bacterium]|nr:SAM-dependent methyltransferase [bacterium]
YIFFLADHDDEYRLSLESSDLAYRHFLEWQFDQIAQEVGVLFDRKLPHSLLFPLPMTMEAVLNLINDSEIEEVWGEDETIGWIYQYFTPEEYRRKIREESAAPRNSYELAIRNQFYTPQYIVQFLTDNTLGRIWYEMRKGDTALKEQCKYMVRRPNEIFLAEGEEQPKSNSSEKKDHSQEEILKQPFYIPHRPKKDPRDIRILDPACGSGHFLLYAFGLLKTMYREAYLDPQSPPSEVTGKTLNQDYPEEYKFIKELPALILENNLHGIDIDLRVTQIASFVLYLRAKRPCKEEKVRKTNIVCAEPMPGEKNMLEEFLVTLDPPLLRDLVREIWGRMKLA